VKTLSFLDTAVSNNNKVLLQWTRLTELFDIGCIDILDYRVYMKASIETTWTMRLAVDPSLSEILITPLTPGETYQFRLIPRNVHGEADFSDSNILVYQASQVPDKPAVMVTTLSTNVNVKIAWVPPFENYKVIEQF
jgi:hypothetical protein